MKKFLATLALTLSAGLFATDATAQDYGLTYDNVTGGVTINALGNLIGYALENDNGAFLEDADGTTQTNHNLILGGFPDSTSFVISETALAPVVAGDYFLGNILPTGLDLAGFQNAVNKEAIYSVALGGDVMTFDLNVVPEPSSLALLGLGGLLIARRRRP